MASQTRSLNFEQAVYIMHSAVGKECRSCKTCLRSPLHEQTQTGLEFQKGRFDESYKSMEDSLK